MHSPKHALFWSLFITVLLLGGLGYWQHYQLQQAKAQTAAALQELRNQGAELSKNLKDITDAFQTSERQTAAAFDDVKTSLGKLGENIDLVYKEAQETERKAQELSGQLQTLKQESAEKISELEKRLQLNLKTQDFSGIVEDVIKSVVSIRTDVGIGSGAIIDSAGYIVTNFHVINGAKSGNVRTFDGVAHAVSVVAADQEKDIAVLKIDGTFSRLKFGDSNNVDVGRRVIALGSPAGLEFSVNEGIISGRRVINGKEYFQTDVALNPGNSGGPLVDASGKIVGISNFKLKDYEGLNFAITSNAIKDFVESILTQV